VNQGGKKPTFGIGLGVHKKRKTSPGKAECCAFKKRHPLPEGKKKKAARGAKISGLLLKKFARDREKINHEPPYPREKGVLGSFWVKEKDP